MKSEKQIIWKANRENVEEEKKLPEKNPNGVWLTNECGLHFKSQQYVPVLVT